MIESNYNFLEIEKKWCNYWHQNQIYKWNPNSNKLDNFIVDTPPPTVSGKLHIGHIFSYTQADFIVRFQRMIGKNVFYPIGFDDNGLPTERLVEKEKKIRASQLPREEFIKICQEVITREEEKFRQLFNNIGISFDWSLEYQTISPISQKISQMSFLDLVQKGQIYRDNQPVFWDPVDHTALSQAEIVDIQKSSVMNYINFTTESKKNITIATTRPELLPACSAIFYNPKDPRYQNLTNMYAITPLFKVKVPILPEPTVSIEKGTGLVMCCSFGDTNDIIWWKQHQLPTRIILNKFGKIKPIDFDLNSIDQLQFDQYYNQIQGLNVTQARQKIISLLQENNLVLKQEEIIQTVKCAERSGAPLEILTTQQWFVKVVDHKDKLLQRSQELNWHPKSMKIKLDNWIESLSWDWCISRQRYFGVAFPVWYSKRAGEVGKVIFADISQLPVNPLKDLPLGYDADEVVPDLDVMDTWSTSSVSPQLSSHAISPEFSIDLERHKKLFPADLRPQAHEIIRTWAFYTLLKSHLHQDTLPWNNIMISGWCLAHDKTKMSKSKGNVITPEKIIENYGSDVVRYWASTSRLGVDTAFSEAILKIGKKIVNKLWNASKFTLHHISNQLDPRYLDSIRNCIDSNLIFSTIDIWILSKLYNVVQKASDALNNYEYAIARIIIEEFFLKDFCDNYLELIKIRIYNHESKDFEGQQSAKYSLYFCFKTILVILAPYLPFITEELYFALHSANNITCKSIHSQFTWPKLDALVLNPELELVGNHVISILELVRKFKTSKQLSIKAPIEHLQIKSTADNIHINASALKDFQAVTSSQIIEIVTHFSIDKNIEIIEEGNISIGISSKLNTVEA